MADAEEKAALQACLGEIGELIAALAAENAVALSAANKALVVDLIKYLKNQHLQLVLDVPDGLIPTPSVQQDGSDSEGGNDGLDGQIGHTPNLGLVLNMLITTFNGDSSYTIDVFLHDVERVCKRRSISGVGRVEIAVGKCRDPGLGLLRDMGLNRLTSWTEFKKQMLELFSEMHDLSSLTLEISRCKQKSEETVTAFSVRLYNLLLKKEKFCNYASEDAFKLAIDKEAIAALQLGVKNPEILKVIRRSNPANFKEAVRTAKMEEIALRASGEDSPSFFKQVKLAYPDDNNHDDKRANYRSSNRPSTPLPYERNDDKNNYRYDDRNNYGNNDRNNYRQDERQNFRADERNFSRNNYRNDNGGDQNYRNYQQRYNQPQQNFRPRGRSRDQDYYQQRRPRSKSADSARGPYNGTPQMRRRFSVPCNCQKCAHLFPPNFIFSRVQCYGCGHFGHTSRMCIHKGDQEETPRAREKDEGQVKLINTPEPTTPAEGEEQAIVKFPIQAHVAEAVWRHK